jgi:acyl-CoA dehydrogenase
MEAFPTIDDPDLSRGAAPADLRSRIRAVATIATQHAAVVDAAGRFPAEAVAAVKAQRLLSILVPQSLGGEGLGIREASDVCYALGQSCASSAMIFAMHNIKVGCLVRHMRGAAGLERLLRRLSAEQLLLASSTTEGQSGGNVRSSEAAIAYDDGRIRLERQAAVISYGAYADGIVTTARRSADAQASDQVLVAFLKSDYTLEPVQRWSALGMRGTCSDGYLLKAIGTPEQILPDPYETIHAQTMVPFAHLLWGSVWMGIAASAVGRAQALMRRAMRQGQALPPGAPHFTRALGSLRTLRGVLAGAMQAFEAAQCDPKALSSVDFQTMITLTKVDASELAVTTVLGALRACGLSGYRMDSEFSVERQLRDVLSSPLMIHNERILSNLATSALLAPLPASVYE